MNSNHGRHFYLLAAYHWSNSRIHLSIHPYLYRRKLEVTQHQLADQHAYTTKLRKQSNDDDLIEQEMLVERQLQKRTVSGYLSFLLVDRLPFLSVFLSLLIQGGIYQRVLEFVKSLFSAGLSKLLHYVMCLT